MINVEVIGDHIRALPSGSGPRHDCGIWSVTKTWCCSGWFTVSPGDCVGEVEDHRRDGPGVFDVHPVAALVDDFHFGLGKARADGSDELLVDERVGAAADDEYGAAECAGGGSVAHPAVSDVCVVGGDLRPYGRADASAAVEPFISQAGRPITAQAAV